MRQPRPLFRPTMANDLANQDAAFDVLTSQNAAVLFADFVGFTKAAENVPPEKVIGFLRTLHMRSKRAFFFENDCTLGKLMGDVLRRYSARRVRAQMALSGLLPPPAPL